MNRLKFKVLITFISILSLTAAIGVGRGSSGSSGGFKSTRLQGPKGFIGQPSSNKQTASNQNEVPKTSSGRSGISAWGIITIIMSIIVGSILAYYVSIFYPILCAERGKYDVMDMTAV